MRIINPIHYFYIVLRLLVTILFAVSTPAFAASDYELGVQAYQAGEYAKARTYWERSVSEDNMSAAYNLGIVLNKGLGGEADPERAVTLFRLAADAGLAVAQHNLALAYYSGNGVEKNNQQAQAWWERAAKHGHIQAQYNLGALLWNGDGVKKNEAEAVKLFRQASDAGNLQARAFLDSILEQSELQMRQEWLDGPGADDPDPAVNQLLSQAREAYLQQNYPQALSLWKQAGEAGSAFATFQLAHLYLDGLGVTADSQAALQLMQQSANQDLAQAQYELAQHYLKGEIVSQNKTLALYWMQSAADNKHIKAKDYLEQLR